MIDRRSPNHGPRPDPVIDMLVLHYTGMRSRDAALDRLCDPAAQVSAHYLIDEDGGTYRLVSEERRAWHAGVSAWGDRPDVNSRSIGIELVNPGHEFGYRPFPEPQIAALEALSTGILSRHPIPPRQVLGHSDVAPLRKRDPGELFPWDRLARHGIGLWPEADLDLEVDTGAMQRDLARFGYAVSDDHLRPVIEAFQRHFRPARIDGVADRETVARLRALLAMLDG